LQKHTKRPWKHHVLVRHHWRTRRGSHEKWRKATNTQRLDKNTKKVKRSTYGKRQLRQKTCRTRRRNQESAGELKSSPKNSRVSSEEEDFDYLSSKKLSLFLFFFPPPLGQDETLFYSIQNHQFWRFLFVAMKDWDEREPAKDRWDWDRNRFEERRMRWCHEKPEMQGPKLSKAWEKREGGVLHMWRERWLICELELGILMARMTKMPLDDFLLL